MSLSTAEPGQTQTNPEDHDLEAIYNFAIALAKDAGNILVKGIEGRQKGRAADEGEKEKDSSVDIVTKTDHDLETFIQNSIKSRYPTHAFLGEETYSALNLPTKPYMLTSSPTWIVDPLDGTVNYTHLFPQFCISIAYVLDFQSVVGVIYAPMLNKIYSGYKGGGAWMEDAWPIAYPAEMSKVIGGRQQLPLINNPVPPLPVNAPKGCTFSCEWGKDRRDIPDGNLHRKVDSFINMAAEIGGRDGKGGMVHGVRSLGSATLDLAYIATGAFDIWWEGGCWEWDVAAGVCILNEAGGLVTTANPPPDSASCEIRDADLGGRLYLAIRPAGDSEDGETGRTAQERVVREVWRRVRGLGYQRVGVGEGGRK
ncbi:MAG: hypothetical protein M1834_001307 [Cirrosporium novae-zelandiae]|nr:MAG: hypothetical protein M1834_001307 [Cirrosporium novae-zelandiae]